MLYLMKTVQTLIRRRILRRLIWIYTVCKCPFYRRLGTNWLICPDEEASLSAGRMYMVTLRLTENEYNTIQYNNFIALNIHNMFRAKVGIIHCYFIDSSEADNLHYNCTSPKYRSQDKVISVALLFIPSLHVDF